MAKVADGAVQGVGGAAGVELAVVVSKAVEEGGGDMGGVEVVDFPERADDVAESGELESGGEVNGPKGHGRNYMIAALTDNDPSMQYGIDTIQGRRG